jgi:hypothetical protein
MVQHHYDHFIRDRFIYNYEPTPLVEKIVLIYRKTNKLLRFLVFLFNALAFIINNSVFYTILVVCKAVGQFILQLAAYRKKAWPNKIKQNQLLVSGGG